MHNIIVSMAGASKKTGSSLKVKTTDTVVNGSPPAGKPLVWANGRGSLCEALPYFRSFKSSLHSASLIAQGFLIDQEADKLDVFGAQVIISSV